MPPSPIPPQLLLDHILDASTDTGIAVVDETFHLTYINPAAEKILQCASREMIGCSVRDQHLKRGVPTDHFDRAVEQIRAGGAFEYCLEHPMSEGVRYYGMRASGLWEDGRLIGYLLMARDITDRHRAELELVRKEQLYETLYRQAPVPYHSLDSDGRIRHVNRAWLDTFGYDEKSIIGHSLFDLLIRPDARIFSRGFERFKRNGEVHNIEFVLRHADGRPMTVSLNGRAVYDEAGGFHHTHCILIDITRQREIEIALGRSETRYRSLFEHTRDALLLYDLKTLRIEDCNPAAERLFGYDREILLTLCVPELSAERETTIQMLKQLREESRTTLSIPCRYIRRGDGLRLPIEIEIVRLEVGNEIKLLGTHREITQRLQLEQALKDRQQWLSTLVETIPYGIEETDREGNILFANAAYHRLLGYLPGELIGRTIWELIPDEEERLLYQTIRARVIEEQPSPETHYSTARCKDGRIIDTQVDWDYRYDEGGEVAGLISIITDITERRRIEMALRDSEKRFRTIFDQTSAGMGTADPQGQLMTVNPALCQLLGYREDELLGKNIHEITHPDDWSSNQQLLTEAAGGGILSYQLEKRYLHKDGSPIWCLLSSAWVPDESGHPLYSIGLIQNITTQKQAEQALRESEERFSRFMDNLPGVVFIKDDRGRTLYVNRYLDDHFGAREWIGKTAMELFPGELGRTMYADEMSALKHGRHERMESVVEHDGDQRVYHTHTFTIPRKGHHPLIGGIAMDITEQVETRQKLELARFALDQASDAVFWMTPKARFVYVNDAACRVLGYSEEELLTMGVPDINPTITDTTCERIWQRIKMKGNVRMETRHRRKDGSEFPVDISANYLIFGDREYNCTIARDITEQRRLQQELQQAHKMEALGQLTGGVAHDFNNILASILGFSDLSRLQLENGAHARLDNYLEEIQIAGRRGRDLVEQMLRFSRNDNSKPQLLKINPLINEAIRLLRSTLPSSILIRQRIESDQLRIMGDPVQIHQAVMNLCVNARDALNGKGTLEIQLGQAHQVELTCSACCTRLEGDWIELSVADDGPGIPEEIRTRIFDPFFTTKEVGKGTGMGLAVIHGILMQHNAHVVVESAIGRGTRFRLFFPPADPQNPFTEDHPATESDGQGRLSGRILVVDDEPTVLKATCALIEHQGLEVVGLSDGQQALDLIQLGDDSFDLLLLDQTMPGLSGTELACRVHQLEPELPVILITGHSDQVNEENAAQFGISRYLRKPVEIPLLQDALRTLLK